MNVNLTHRELILIRVALIRSLPLIRDTAPKSYEDSHALLSGKLWVAERAARHEEPIQ